MICKVCKELPTIVFSKNHLKWQVQCLCGVNPVSYNSEQEAVEAWEEKNV